MKYKILIISILQTITLFAQPNEPKAIQKSLGVIDLFKQGEYEKIFQLGDEIMQRRTTPDRFQGIWESLAAINGDLNEVGSTAYLYLDTMHVTTTKLKFKNASIGLRLSFDTSWKMAGLYVVDAEPIYNIPNYVNTFGFYEIKIPFGPTGFEGEAILTVPIQQKKYPCVIIIGGSGPIDKDATIGPNKIYKDFSWGLAAKGVASVRFDKRTKNYFGKIMEAHKNGKYYTIEQEYLEDIKEIIAKTMKKSAIDAKRVYLLGHSQGAGLMPLFLKQNSKIAGAIMAAGNYTSMPNLMQYQFDYLMPMQVKTKADSAIFDNLRAQAKNAAKSNLPNTFPNDSLPAMYPFSYWNYMNKIDLIKLAKSNKKPVFIIQGERDYQVPISEYNFWKEALQTKNNYTFNSYKKLNHLFLEGEGKSVPNEYFLRSNVPEYVIDDISKWINAQPRK
jgi:hypothetical protein